MNVYLADIECKLYGHFDHIENKHSLYCGEDCMKKFCSSLREHGTNIINFDKKKKILLTKKAKITPRCNDMLYFWKITMSTAHSICNLRFNVPNEFPVVFHNGSNYDYQFIIGELADEFEGHFESLEGNKEKCKIFSVPIEKEIRSY